MYTSEKYDGQHRQSPGKDFLVWFVLTTLGFTIVQVLVRSFEISYLLNFPITQLLFSYIVAGGILGFLQWFKLRRLMDHSLWWVMSTAISFFIGFLGIALVLRISRIIKPDAFLIPMDLLHMASILSITFLPSIGQFLFLSLKKISLQLSWLLHGLASGIFIILVAKITLIASNQMFSPDDFQLVTIRQIVTILLSACIYGAITSFAMINVRFPGKTPHQSEKNSEKLIEVTMKPFKKRLLKWIGIFMGCALIWILILFPLTMILNSQITWILVIGVAIAGTIRGTFQWLGFRKYFFNSKLWIAITAAGETMGVILVLVLGEGGALNWLFRGEIPTLIALLLITLMIGLPVGFGQWLFLRKTYLVVPAIWIGYEAISFFLVVASVSFFQSNQPYDVNGLYKILFVIFEVLVIAAAYVLPSATAFAWLPFKSPSIANNH